MSDLSDDKLKSLFQKRLGNYEAKPEENSWKLIEKKLPPPSLRPGQRALMIIGTAIVVSVLLTAIVIPSTQGDSNGLEVALLPEKPEAERLITVDSAMHNQEMEEITQNVTSNENILEYEVTKSTRRVKESRRIITTIERHDVDSTNNEGVAEIPIKNSQSNAPEKSTLESLPNETISNVQRKPIVRMNHGEQNRTISKASEDSLLRKADTLLLEGVVASLPKLDSTMKEKETHYSSNHWLFKLVPFYTTGVFMPLPGDNVDVGDFSQSTNLLNNRLGLAIEVGYCQVLTRKINVEYAIGYKIFSKDFEYTATEVGLERNFEVSRNKISAISQVIKAEAMLKSAFLSSRHPLLFSLSYEKAFGSLTPHIGGSLLNYGLGFEKTLGDKMFLRPMISYGIPLGNNAEHFRLRPVGWNLEIVWKLQRKSN
jgi:hypothetical protein